MVCKTNNTTPPKKKSSYSNRVKATPIIKIYTQNTIISSDTSISELVCDSRKQIEKYIEEIENDERFINLIQSYANQSFKRR